METGKLNSCDTISWKQIYAQINSINAMKRYETSSKLKIKIPEWCC